MKNSHFAPVGDRCWAKVCLSLLATLILILTASLLASGQNERSSPPRSRGTRSELNVSSQREIEGFLEAGFSTTNLSILLGLAALSLVVARKVRLSNEVSEGGVSRSRILLPEENKSTRAGEDISKVGPVSTTNSIYSAYRIEQNVIKLVTGDRYNCEVLASRAPDDRRAIEAFLNKVITSPVSSNDEIIRARTAMENYGFVARHSSSLLMAPEPFERADAARSLGEIGSSRALPFLLEALYDGESIVRNHAVVSLGQLGNPNAIGPLLDRATRLPELPVHLVSRSLTACSFEVDPSGGVEYGDMSTIRESDACHFDLRSLLASSTVTDLPDQNDDDEFNQILEAAISDDVLERIAAVKALAQYPFKSAVDWLVSVSRHDSESSVKSVALSSLAFIDHESVFPAVLLAMADESRDVRAAAARAFSRLSFDRLRAYFHFYSTADDETLRTVGSACARSGIVTQNINRLARCDRFQTLETFALICLLTRAQMVDSVIDAVVSHSNLIVRIGTVRLLANTGHQYLVERFEELASMDDLTEEVKTVVLEGIETLKRRQFVEEDQLELRKTESEFNPDGTTNQAVDEVSLDELFASDSSEQTNEHLEKMAPALEEKGIALFATDFSDDVRRRLQDHAAGQRAGALADLARAGGEEAFALIVGAFEDPSPVVRNAAAHALIELDVDPATTFARALQESSSQRRINIGIAMASSGLAGDAISKLHRRSISLTHNSLALLFLMARAGEINPLLKSIEENIATDTRVTCVKVLSLSGQVEVLHAFRRLSLRPSLPNEVRSALMEAIYQLSAHA